MRGLAEQVRVERRSPSVAFSTVSIWSDLSEAIGLPKRVSSGVPYWLLRLLLIVIARSRCGRDSVASPGSVESSLLAMSLAFWIRFFAVGKRSSVRRHKLTIWPPVGSVSSDRASVSFGRIVGSATAASRPQPVELGAQGGRMVWGVREHQGLAPCRATSGLA